MILDARNEFCDSVLLNTGAAGTYNIGNQIDLGATQRSIGAPRTPLFLELMVTAGIRVAASTGTIQFQLVSDSTVAPSTDGTQSIHAVSRSVVTSTTSDVGLLAIGKVLMSLAVPLEGSVPFERYVGIQQITGTTAISAGRVDAFLTSTPSEWKSYDAPWQV